MDSTVKALQNLYIALGGSLTDTYSDIADGAPVSNYTLIPDVINACAQIAVPAELPSVAKTDEGKVLIVDSNGKWSVGNVPAELPAVSGANEGAVLMVGNDGKWGVDYVPAELPVVTADDDGDMLKVVDGEWEKFTPEP